MSSHMLNARAHVAFCTTHAHAVNHSGKNPQQYTSTIALTTMRERTCAQAVRQKPRPTTV